eukprot:SAG22_NODE_10752_length_517_cov_40.282297_1_plen_41_part_10
MGTVIAHADWFQLGEVQDLPKMGRLLVQQPQKGARDGHAVG